MSGYFAPYKTCLCIVVSDFVSFWGFYVCVSPVFSFALIFSCSLAILLLLFVYFFGFVLLLSYSDLFVFILSHFIIIINLDVCS